MTHHHGLAAACARCSPAAPPGPDTSARPCRSAVFEAPGWAPAVPGSPRRPLDRGPWWELFGDADLNALVEQVEVSNQNVAAAVAAYAQARALVREPRAAAVPDVSADGSAACRRRRRRISGPATGLATGARELGSRRLGRRAAASRARQASAQASEADLAAARCRPRASSLPTTSRCATPTPNSRCCAHRRGYERALTITQNRYAAGIAAQPTCCRPRPSSRARAPTRSAMTASARSSSTRSRC